MSSEKLHSRPGSAHLTQQVIRQYLQEELSAAQMHQIEKHLLSCKLCNDAVEGLATVPDTSHSAATIEQLKLHIRDKTAQKEGKTIPFIWKPIGIAATISILLAVTLLIFTPDTTQKTDTIAVTKEVQPPIQEEEPIQTETAPASAGSPAPATVPSADNLALKAPATKKSAAPARKEKAEQFDVEKNESLAPDVALDQLEEEIITKEPLAVVESIDNAKSRTAQPAAPQLKQAPFNGRETTGITQNLVTVTGKVVSADDKIPLPGVNVTVKGTTTGTLTDAEGKYVLTVPQESTLLFNYIGYSSKELAAKNKDIKEVAMDADTQALSEVVVIGYGTAETEEKPYEYIRPKPEETTATFKNYIKNNLKYPQGARDKKIEGSVKVEFVVEPDGSLRDFRIKKSLGYGLDEEAIRLIKEGPAWKPAQLNGKPVRRKVNVSIPFKL